MKVLLAIFLAANSTLIHNDQCEYYLMMLPAQVYSDWYQYSTKGQDGKHPFWERGEERQSWFWREGEESYAEPLGYQTWNVTGPDGQFGSIQRPMHHRVMFRPTETVIHSVSWELHRNDGTYLVSGQYTFLPECLYDPTLVFWDFEDGVTP